MFLVFHLSYHHSFLITSTFNYCMIPASAFSVLSNTALTCIFNGITHYTHSSLPWSNPILFDCHTFIILLLQPEMYTHVHRPTCACMHTYIVCCSVQIFCFLLIIFPPYSVSYERVVSDLPLMIFMNFSLVFQFSGQWYLETTIWVL